MFETRDEYDEAVRTAQAAAAAYYDAETLLLDDDSYDALVRKITATEAARPEWGTSELGSKVAGGVSAGGDVRHSAPMLSLDNVFDDDELRGWYDRMVKLAGVAPALCVEPKLDGLALCARYKAGRLELVATRGDGVTGEDVTRNARGIVGLPEMLDEPLDLEVRGECVMTAEQFDRANELRTAAEHGAKPAFANPRNAVAGSIRRQHVTYVTPMTFAAYGVVGAGVESHAETMAWLAELGFMTAVSMAPRAGRADTIDAAVAASNAIAAARAELDGGIDGVVVKADLAGVRDVVGSSSRAPRWAVARKFPADTKLTRVAGIEVSVGRTGALTLRADLEPVSVGGTTIRSCTLSNPNEVARKDIRVGDQVWVRRAGEVIPEITAVHLPGRPDGLEAWVAPTECPRCASSLDRSQRVWRCPRGRACGAVEALEYAVSRDALDIEGIGSTLIAKLVDAGMVADVADLFSLTAEQLAGLDRMGETSAAAVVAEIERARGAEFSRVLTALGVRMTGRRMSRRLAKHFGSMGALRAATVEELAEVEGVGDARAERIRAELDELGPVIDRLAAAGVNMVEPVEVAVAAESPFTGKKVCVTGSVPGQTRDSAQALVERLGGVASSGVSKTTDVLVAGAGAGSKLAKAEQLGVTVMSADEFLAVAAEHGAL